MSGIPLDSPVFYRTSVRPARGTKKDRLKTGLFCFPSVLPVAQVEIIAVQRAGAATGFDCEHKLEDVSYLHPYFFPLFKMSGDVDMAALA